MQNVLYKGRPADEAGRLDKELRVYDFLDELGIEYDCVDTEPAETMEVCAEIDKLLAPAVICKNLFLCNRQKTQFYLLMIKNDKKFKTKEISGQLGVARLSFGDAEFMEDPVSWASPACLLAMQSSWRNTSTSSPARSASWGS